MRRTESLVLPGNITLRGIKQHSEQNSTEQMNWAYSDGKACTSTRPISVTKEITAITATALASLTGKKSAKLEVSECYSAIVLD